MLLYLRYLFAFRTINLIEVYTMTKSNRFGARKDKNHDIVVSALRTAGYIVDEIYRAGQGIPDLLVWTKTKMRVGVVIEIKFEDGKLNDSEKEYFLLHPECAKGVAYSPEEALQIMYTYDDYFSNL